MKSFKSYAEKGINISVRENIESNEVDIKYDGLLAKSGADSVYVHAGYEDSTVEEGSWEDVKDIKMEKTSHGAFKATIPLEESHHKLSFVFKDSANNWDNNSGNDYWVDVRTIR